MAAASDIKPEAYTPDHVLQLFRAFQEVRLGLRMWSCLHGATPESSGHIDVLHNKRSDARARVCREPTRPPAHHPLQDAAREVLLFLKSVRRVELHIKADADSAPRLLLSASLEPSALQSAAAPSALQLAGDGHPQHAVARFVKGTGGSSDFFQRLQAAAEGELPQACGAVTVTVQGGVPSTPALGPAGSASHPQEEQHQQQQQQQWMVCSLLAGARARRMAVEAAKGPRGEGKGWVPWAGVAAPLQPPISLVSIDGLS